jgi:hypothetical protein
MKPASPWGAAHSQAFFGKAPMKPLCLAAAWIGIITSFAAQAAEPTFWQSTEAEDYKIDRVEVFEFTKKPTITRNGDRVTIRFTSKDFCDATVVIEREDGTILRHLASGCLGPNAPEPFRKGSLEQTVVWDGKDELGKYLDDLGEVRVRVSLGLKPQFEKTLFWHPKRRAAFWAHPRAVAQPEGVYVYDGGGVERIKLFSHDGKYIRTVYPFPASKLDSVKGLGWNRFADGHKAPAHRGYWQATYLSTGTGRTAADWGTAATAFAMHDGKIALVPDNTHREIDRRLTRLKTDGTTGDLSLFGGEIRTPFPMHSAAFSPDGKWLYLAGSYKNIQPPFQAMPARVEWRHGVYRMEYASDKPAELWLGGDKAGKGETQFNHPSSVCIDAKGRIYIADNHNDRIQIFSPDKKLLKSIPVKGPAILKLHHKTQELYSFSWTMSMGHSAAGGRAYPVPAVLRVFEPFKSDKPKFALPLPFPGYRPAMITTRLTYSDYMPYRVELDSYTEPATFWMVNNAFAHSNLSRWQIKNGKLVQLDNWASEVQRAVKQERPPEVMRQRMLVDPQSGILYSMEQDRVYSTQIVRIRPDTGQIDIIKLPHRSDDYAFDNSGHLYLRNNRIISRFTINGLREVPFDYGEAHGGLRSVLVLPGTRTANWIEPGMGVNPKGELAVGACNFVKQRERALGRYAYHRGEQNTETWKYTPRIFPGRQRYGEIHIFDKHGKIIASDSTAQGMTYGHGVLMDPKGDIYYTVAMNRMYDGKPFHPLTGCVIKFKRGKGRFYSTRGEVSLRKENQPKVPQQIAGFWIADAEWIYPGVGFARNAGPCTCWDTEMALDYFGRSFIPSRIRHQVAVLDTNGNLILNVGRYGNVDDGVPLDKAEKYRTQKPRSIGGDEVGLVYTNFTATHSDRRLFISDTGNGRILSVKLDYHVNERIPLKTVLGKN